MSILTDAKARKEAQALLVAASAAAANIEDKNYNDKAALDEAVVALANDATALAGSISTGLASSVDALESFRMPHVSQLVEAAPITVGPPGSYRAQNLQRFFKASGTKVEPVDGFFTPQDQEEFDILEHFTKDYNMVELQVAPEPSQ